MDGTHETDKAAAGWRVPSAGCEAEAGGELAEAGQLRTVAHDQQLGVRMAGQYVGKGTDQEVGTLPCHETANVEQAVGSGRQQGGGVLRRLTLTPQGVGVGGVEGDVDTRGGDTVGRENVEGGGGVVERAAGAGVAGAAQAGGDPLAQQKERSAREQTHVFIIHGMAAEPGADLAVGWCLERNLTDEQAGVRLAHGAAQRRLQADLKEVGPAEHEEVGTLAAHESRQVGEACLAVAHVAFGNVEGAEGAALHCLDSASDGGSFSLGREDCRDVDAVRALDPVQQGFQIGWHSAECEHYFHCCGLCD